MRIDAATLMQPRWEYAAPNGTMTGPFTPLAPSWMYAAVGLLTSCIPRNVQQTWLVRGRRLTSATADAVGACLGTWLAPLSVIRNVCAGAGRCGWWIGDVSPACSGAGALRGAAEEVAELEWLPHPEASNPAAMDATANLPNMPTERFSARRTCEAAKFSGPAQGHRPAG